MKRKEIANAPESELHFELKYCERCGGLWVRPVGGAQIYCLACERAVEELPPPSRLADMATMPQQPQWLGDEGDFEIFQINEVEIDDLERDDSESNSFNSCENCELSDLNTPGGVA